MKLLTILVASLVSTAASAGSLRCQGALVRVGMAAEEVQTVCGQPLGSAESQHQTKEIGPDGKETIRYAAHVVHLYSEGSGSFFRTVTLIDGVVTAVDDLSHRFEDSNKDGAACADDATRHFREGDSVVLVAYLCGSPQSQRIVADEFLPFDGPKKLRLRRSESWQYRSARRELNLEIEDGRVSRIISKLL